MTPAGRLERERAFHDQQALERRRTFERDPERLRFADADYLDHESWIRPALARLGLVAGRAVLDYGCGHGMAAVVLARAGARVTAFDLSPAYLTEARNRAAANAVDIGFVVADGERLPFASRAFDAVWSNAVVHHLDVEQATREIYRVLRPGGVAVVCEPWGGNPLLRLARHRLPYPGKGRTVEEEPLGRRHLAAIRRVFRDVQVEGHQLFSMARKVLPPGRLVAGLEWLDRLLLPRLPGLQLQCRYVVLTLRRPLDD